MAKRIVHLHIGNDGKPSESFIQLMDEQFHIASIPTGGDVDLIVELIRQAERAGVDAVALDGIAFELSLGHERKRHADADRIEAAAQCIPLADGSQIRGAFERWAIQLVQQAEPGFFTRRKILFAPGLNHNGLVDGLSSFTNTRRWADPVFCYGHSRPVASEAAMRHRAARLLKVANDKPFRRIFPQSGTPGRQRSAAPFEWAEILAGDIPAIRRYAPDDLARKIVIGEYATEEDVADLHARGVTALLTTMPPVTDEGLDASRPARWSSAVIEACMRSTTETANLREDDFLNLMAGLDWKPALVYLQSQAKINRFAFVIHPLNMRFIYAHKMMRYLRWLPDRWIEFAASYIPPLRVSRMTGMRSESTGQVVEGDLYTLGTTPRVMMKRNPSFTYRKLEQIAKDAEERGARIVGLGAFTSVVGDAGETVSRNSDIAITSGNSLTVAATLETAKQAAIGLGIEDLTQGQAMVIGATGSIGAVCSRLLAQALGGVTLVAPRPERLIALMRQIQEETPGAVVHIATSPDEYVADMHVIVTTTSALGQRILDITKCKPGAVICDVARPPDIEKWEADLRPDVLVIESGEILLPGDLNLGYDIGLPPKTVYACMAETALLAMEGRFENYSIGRELDLEKVKEIYRLFRKHGLRLAGMRSFGEYITDDDLVERRRLADELRADPAQLRALQESAKAAIQAGDRKKAVLDEKEKNGSKGSRNIKLVAAAVALTSIVFRRRKKV